MPTWPKDTMAARIAFYGDPRGPNGVNPRWYAQNVVSIKPPYPMTYAGKPIKTISIHKKCAESLLAALTEIWEVCGKDAKEIAKYGLQEFGGTFNYRLIRGSNSLSNHAFAIAIDIAPAGNALGKTRGTMPDFAVKAFESRGWRWGGRYVKRKDLMHFEAVS